MDEMLVKLTCFDTEAANTVEYRRAKTQKNLLLKIHLIYNTFFPLALFKTKLCPW